MSTTGRSTAISSGCAASSAPWTARSNRSKPSMASDTDLPRNDERPPALSWSRRLSLRQRILAVNIFAIVIIAGSLFYLDSFRSQLVQARADQVRSETGMIAHMLAVAPREAWQPLLVRLGADAGARLRVYEASGALREDSWIGAPPTYELRETAGEPLLRTVARALDNGFDAIVRAKRPERYVEAETDSLAAWPEGLAA